MFQKTLTGGRYNESNYPVQELWRKGGGGRIFEGGVLAGHYGTMGVQILHDSTIAAYSMKILYLSLGHLSLGRVSLIHCTLVSYPDPHKEPCWI